MSEEGLPASDPPSESPARPAKDAGPIILQSTEILQGRREIWIEHGADMYRLRVTANNKLYLTK